MQPLQKKPKHKLIRALTIIFNLGYRAGHDDTVGNCYVDVLPCNMDTHHDDIVREFVTERSVAEKN